MSSFENHSSKQKKWVSKPTRIFALKENAGKGSQLHANYSWKKLCEAENRDSVPDSTAENNYDGLSFHERQFLQRVEKKYGKEKAQKRLGPVDEWRSAFLTEGYDKNDPFIDDTEVADDYVPSTIETKHHGFYLHRGPLEMHASNRHPDLSSDDELMVSPTKKMKSALISNNKTSTAKSSTSTIPNLARKVPPPQNKTFKSAVDKIKARAFKSRSLLNKQTVSRPAAALPKSAPMPGTTQSKITAPSNQISMPAKKPAAFLEKQLTELLSKQYNSVIAKTYANTLSQLDATSFVRLFTSPDLNNERDMMLIQLLSDTGVLQIMTTYFTTEPVTEKSKAEESMPKLAKENPSNISMTKVPQLTKISPLNDMQQSTQLKGAEPQRRLVGQPPTIKTKQQMENVRIKTSQTPILQPDSTEGSSISQTSTRAVKNPSDKYLARLNDRTKGELKSFRQIVRNHCGITMTTQPDPGGRKPRQNIPWKLGVEAAMRRVFATAESVREQAAVRHLLARYLDVTIDCVKSHLKKTSAGVIEPLHSKMQSTNENNTPTTTMATTSQQSVQLLTSPGVNESFMQTKTTAPKTTNTPSSHTVSLGKMAPMLNSSIYTGLSHSSIQLTPQTSSTDKPKSSTSSETKKEKKSNMSEMRANLDDAQLLEFGNNPKNRVEPMLLEAALQEMQTSQTFAAYHINELTSNLLGQSLSTQPVQPVQQQPRKKSFPSRKSSDNIAQSTPDDDDDIQVISNKFIANKVSQSNQSSSSINYAINSTLLKNQRTPSPQVTIVLYRPRNQQALNIMFKLFDCDNYKLVRTFYRIGEKCLMWSDASPSNDLVDLLITAYWLIDGGAYNKSQRQYYYENLAALVGCSKSSIDDWIKHRQAKKTDTAAELVNNVASTSQCARPPPLPAHSNSTTIYYGTPGFQMSKNAQFDNSLSRQKKNEINQTYSNFNVNQFL